MFSLDLKRYIRVVKRVYFSVCRLRQHLFMVFAMLLPAFVMGQEIDSIRMSMENGKVRVEYDFEQTDGNIPYELYLYSSHDNFTKPLQLTTGDVGKNVYPGYKKIILWDAAKELGNFKGDIITKIKGLPYKPFVTFVNVPDQLVMKKGSEYTFEWTFDKKPEKLLLKILKSGVPVQEPIIIDNIGNYNWSVPKVASPGKGYTLELRDPDNLLRVETSHEFKVRRKIPLGYIAVPTVAIGAAVIFLFAPDNGIPAPPKPPSN